MQKHGHHSNTSNQCFSGKEADRATYETKLVYLDQGTVEI